MIQTSPRLSTMRTMAGSIFLRYIYGRIKEADHLSSLLLCSKSEKLSDDSQNISYELVVYFVRFGYNKDEPYHEGRNRNMSITATELKNNLGKYLLLAATEDIFITRNGKVVAKLSNPHQDRVDIAKSLFGILPADVTLEEAKEERLNRI